MTSLRICLFTALVASALGSLEGCATGGVFNALSPWRQGVVAALVPSTAVPDGTDLRCLPPPDASASTPATVVIVRLRSGRASYTEAFALPVTAAPRVGDHVVVLHGGCALRSATRAAG